MDGIIKKKLLKAFYLWKNYLRRGWHSKIQHSIFFKAWALLSGFSPDSLVIYRQRGWTKSDLISDYRRCLYGPFINARWSYILDDKLVFEKFFTETVHFRFHVLNGRLMANTAEGAAEDELLQRLFRGEEFIIKPRRGGGGNGVQLLGHYGDSMTIDGKQFSQVDFMTEIQNCHDSLIYPFFHQDGFSHEIFPATLNTIRVLSIIDPGTGMPFVARALHRFGTRHSIPVDNWSSGGVCAEIDVPSGVLGSGVIFPYDKKLSWHECHPDTGKPIAGRQIPAWQRIVTMALDAHSRIPYLPYIGWDIVLSGDAVLILEGNTNSDVNLFQVHQPMLTDERLRSVFRYYGLAGK